MKQQPPNQASGASETARFFCTQISSAAGAAGELCTTQRKEPDMAKRENEGKKEKKQKKERKEKRKQDRGLLLNPISVPRARTRACEGRHLIGGHLRSESACTYARVRGAAPCVHMHVLRSGRGGDGDHRQLLRFARTRLPHLGVVLPPLRPAANSRPRLLLRLMPEVRRNPQRHHSLPKLAS